LRRKIPSIAGLVGFRDWLLAQAQSYSGEHGLE